MGSRSELRALVATRYARDAASADSGRGTGRATNGVLVLVVEHEHSALLSHSSRATATRHCVMTAHDQIDETTSPLHGLRCIYCPAVLGADTRLAHAVPNVLGGRKKSRMTECSSCNQYFAPLEDDFG